MPEDKSTENSTTEKADAEKAAAAELERKRKRIRAVPYTESEMPAK